MQIRTTLLGALAALTLASQAEARVLLDYSGTGAQMPSPSDLDLGFESGDGLAEFAFTVRGFGSLDGVDAFVSDRRVDDTLYMTIDLENVLISNYSVGGAGSNAARLAPSGYRADVQSACLGCGGTARVTFAVPLTAGVHTLRFAYVSEYLENVEDEAWAIEDLRITGPSAGVPEPATWALMILGFGGAGAALRRRDRFATQKMTPASLLPRFPFEA
jgi:hypothetical protein